MTKQTKNKPTHVAKIRFGDGEKAVYERVGVAWEDTKHGTLYFKPYGRQLIGREGVTFYPIDDQ